MLSVQVWQVLKQPTKSQNVVFQLNSMKCVVSSQHLSTKQTILRSWFVPIPKEIKDISTEEKIKNAARIVFQRKGFAATRTRDIAEEAGINLALLNYYFRSKEKLFDIVILETLSHFLQTMVSVFNDESTSFEKKIELIAENYINFGIEYPDAPS